jgi:hypothetical protein
MAKKLQIALKIPIFHHETEIIIIVKIHFYSEFQPLISLILKYSIKHNFRLIDIVLSSSVNDELYDGLILISTSVNELKKQEKLKHLSEQIDQYAKVRDNLLL